VLDVFRRAVTDPDILAPALAPDFEGVDHRHLSSHSLHGAAAYIDHLQGWRQVADDLVFRERDILALVPSAMLVATLHTGNARNGGGAYERSFLTLLVLDDSARLARAEWFDDDRADDALARFDEIVAGAEPRRLTVRRRVRGNTASRQLERQWSAIEARDVEAITALNAQVKVIHHPTGATYGAPEIATLFRDLWRGTNIRASQEILATLGDSLVLSRRSAAHDGVDARFGSVGPVDVEYVHLSEVDEHGQAHHAEVFAADRLRDAVARLYERHAELLPAGPEKVRAAATAASFVVVKDATFDPKRFARALAPDFESIDHRHLSSWSLRGADAYLAHLRALHEVADDIEFRQLDVIALSPSAQLVRVLHTGTDRAGGGRYERPFLRLAVADTAGHLARAEWFDDDREADALARFDEIVASDPIGAPQPAARRRVTPNAATANAERFGAAVAARDLDALARELCDEVETLHQQTGVTYGRKGFLATWRSMFRAAEMSRRQETVASLGDRLALAHHTIRLEGFTEEHIAALGTVDIDEVVLFEIDDSGRTRRFDLFPVEKLGDALVRMYERHAELLPEGPESERAAATARAVAVWNGALDLERVAAVTGPLVELVDHRSLHLWSAHGADEYLEQWRGHFALTDTSVRTDGVLALERHALLVRRTYFGTAREGGGEFVTPVLELWVYGADGRSARIEIWEPDAEAEALARFDELTGANPPVIGPFENVASRAWREVITAWRGRDLERFAALQPGPLRYRDHRRLFQLDLDREGFLEFTRPLLTMQAGRASLDLLASRGERLALMRFTLEMEDDAVGPSAIDSLLLIETDEHGTIVAYDRWDLDDRDAALVALDARWAASDDAWHERSWQDARLAHERRDWDAWAEWLENAASRTDRELFARFNARDWPGIEALAAPDLVFDERRRMLHNTCGREVWLEQFRVLYDVPASRFATTLRSTRGDRLALSLHRFEGEVAHGGGPLAMDDHLVLHEVDRDGRIVAIVLFDLEDEAAAHAELDARFAAGEGAAHPHVLRAFAETR